MLYSWSFPLFAKFSYAPPNAHFLRFLEEEEDNVIGTMSVPSM